jgi:hypothetical protein
MSDFRELIDEEFEILTKLLIMSMRTPDNFKSACEEIHAGDFSVQLIMKRVVAYKLPITLGAAVALSVFGIGNPGRLVLSIIDTMEAHDKEPSEIIDIEFVMVFVYPDGIYTDEAFRRIWNERKTKQSVGYNILI